MLKMLGMLKTRTLAVAAAAVLFAAGAGTSHAALSRATGGAGFSGTLSTNPTIRQQQLLADPDDPIFGSSSVLYDASIVSLVGFSFGPGYMGSGAVEVINQSEELTFMQELNSFLLNPAGEQTGYVQVQFFKVAGTGQIEIAEGFEAADEDGPAGVDTHQFFFEYLEGVSPTTVATYTIYADAGNRDSGNKMDTMTGLAGEGNPFTLLPDQIASATVSAPLAAPVPAAVYQGGAGLAALAVLGGIRRMGLKL